jgi:hypothetical protein
LVGDSAAGSSRPAASAVNVLVNATAQLVFFCYGLIGNMMMMQQLSCLKVLCGSGSADISVTRARSNY